MPNKQDAGRNNIFLVDSTLKKLARWLLIMGYDTICHEGSIDRELLNRGAREKRIVLSRKKELAERNYRGRLLVVRADGRDEQIEEVIEALHLKPRWEEVLTRCLSCNEPLEKISQSDVTQRVPPYVAKTQITFFTCTRCGSVFWPGTHRERIVEYLRRRNLMDRP
ncbi:MAG: Mut7-C RNAse domain-containing protein [Syntrophales bacterium]|nr:Mut7-C RNAse domain-containing protein [Syntrophales bacterium]